MCVYEALFIGFYTKQGDCMGCHSQELRFGDNDSLSAMVAAIVDAHWLFLLTDVDALYDKNPMQHADAKPIRLVHDIDEVIKEGAWACIWRYF